MGKKPKPIKKEEQSEVQEAHPFALLPKPQMNTLQNLSTPMNVFSSRAQNNITYTQGGGFKGLDTIFARKRGYNTKTNKLHLSD